MNTALAPVRSFQTDTLLHPHSTTDRARLTFAQRSELRLGIWLLLRSARRLDGVRDHRAHQRLRQNADARTNREHQALQAHALNIVRT